MLASVSNVWAQLPDINVVNLRGRNFIAFKNQYDKLERIEVQRSNDSLKGYVTIGVLSKPKKGDGTYADEKPMIGKNHYQLRIVFNEEMDWYSKRKSILLDSSNVVTSALTKGDEATLAAPAAGVITTAPVVEEFNFTASAHVFTNTFTGHINIELESTIEKRYSLVFYDANNGETVRIDRINKDRVVLDKHNFNGRGVYKFILKEAGVQVETGYVRVD
jgi:hypothetical protein